VPSRFVSAQRVLGGPCQPLYHRRMGRDANQARSPGLPRTSLEPNRAYALQRRRTTLIIALTPVLLSGCGSGTDGKDPATGEPEVPAGAGGVAAMAASGTGGSGGRVAGAGAGSSAPVGGAGVAGGGGSSGAAPGAGSSATEACIEYFVASAVRLAECSGNTPSPLELLHWTSELYCPDALFASGSTRTPEGLITCAQAWRTFPCEALAAGEVPDCTTPGTRAPGETCIHDAQCDQLLCAAATTGECGVCQARAAAGEPCGMGVACERGHACQRDPALPSAVCVPSPTFELPAQVGEACGGSTRCVNDAYCDGSNPNGGGFCVALEIGSPCAQRDFICGMELYCANVDETCRAFPGVGEQCGRATDSTSACAPGTECVGGTCELAMVAPPGEPCGELGCGEGNQCRCLDPACSEPRCVVFGLPGDACTDPNVVCNAGTECLAGVCEPRDPLPFQCN
jgi:hypothetical protein